MLVLHCQYVHSIHCGYNPVAALTLFHVTFSWRFFMTLFHELVSFRYGYGVTHASIADTAGEEDSLSYREVGDVVYVGLVLGVVGTLGRMQPTADGNLSDDDIKKSEAPARLQS